VIYVVSLSRVVSWYLAVQLQAITSFRSLTQSIVLRVQIVLA
jgi:hypothetical protein